MKAAILFPVLLLLSMFATAQTMDHDQWVKTITANAISSGTQSVHPGFALYYSQVGDVKAPYLVYIPRSFDPSKNPPVVVFLHGAILARDSFHHIDPAIADEPVFAVADTLHAVIVFPFCKRDFTWPAQQAVCEHVANIVGQVKKRYGITDSKAYIGGISMGGNATFWFINNKPGVFAGFYTFSAYPHGMTVNYNNITKDKPLISMNAKDDSVFPYDDALALYEQHKAAAPGWQFRSTDRGGHRFIYGPSGYRYILFALQQIIK